jgi:hypothetical protein
MGGGASPPAQAAGFGGDYGARFGQGGEPAGARIWLPGNVELPADYARPDRNARDGADEDAAADRALAARKPNPALLAAAGPAGRSLRLRDGGGIVQVTVFIAALIRP